MMDKYGLSTQVLDTYVADFHGTTVAIFEQEHPDQETNKAVCYDCHGIHDIARVDDPTKGLQVRENLLARCQVCHPDASENFPTAWLSHYIPSPERYPLVFTVDVFYQVFIPTVLGGMAILVVLDAGTRLRRGVRRKPAPPAAAPPPLPSGAAAFPPPETPAPETPAPETPAPLSPEGVTPEATPPVPPADKPSAARQDDEEAPADSPDDEEPRHA